MLTLLYVVFYNVQVENFLTAMYSSLNKGIILLFTAEA